jgi:hypothetical protein
MIKANRSVTQSEIEHIESRSIKDSNNLREKLWSHMNINSDLKIVLWSNVAMNRSEYNNRSIWLTTDFRSNNSV